MSFNRVVNLSGGRALNVEALAIDPRTNSPVIPGDVDRHFLERWGALMASSFLDGFGQALSRRGTTVSVYGDVLVQNQDDGPSLTEISLEALGQVGRRAAGQLERNFDRPPTVTVPAGTPVGVFVVDVDA
jgi:type IV secretory pathway VirB10-like protein